MSNGNATRKALLAPWQPPTDGRGKPFSLAPLKPSAKPFSGGDKAQDKAAVDALATELDALQDLFFADKRYKLLVLLQGTDTAGKDGTIRAVFSRTSPLGVHTVGWKAPTEEERQRLQVRKQWADYQQAYEALLGATSTPWAPWTVVPADSRTHRNLMVASLVHDRLQALDLRYPPSDPALSGLRIK